jgi:hypothetical protein
VRLEGLGQLKRSNDLIGNQTRDFPACSIVTQPTTLPHVLKEIRCLLKFETRTSGIGQPQSIRCGNKTRKIQKRSKAPGISRTRFRYAAGEMARFIVEEGMAGKHEHNCMNNLQHLLHMKGLKLLNSNGGEKSHKFHNCGNSHTSDPAGEGTRRPTCCTSSVGPHIV